MYGSSAHMGTSNVRELLEVDSNSITSTGLKLSVSVVACIIDYAINNNGCLEGVSRKLLINQTPVLVGTRFRPLSCPACWLRV